MQSQGQKTIMRKRPKRHDPATSTSTASGTEPTRSSNSNQFGLDLAPPADCRLVRYHVKLGDNVSTGDLIASCQNDSNHGTEIIEFRSPADGTVTSFLVPEDTRFDGSKDPVVQLEFCIHNVVIEGLCAVCGRTITAGSSIGAVSSTTVDPTAGLVVPKKDAAMVNVEGGLRLEVTRDEALNVREATVTRLFHSRRLSLVLDLDHTLVHCTDDPRAINIVQNAPATAHLHTFELDRKLLILKLRPGLPQFLKTMKEQYFELYVYTAGTRAYAQRVCSIIDPDGSVFGERIVSRDDTPELGTDKDLTRLFPVDDTMVVVVDDRDVWNGVANLLTCEPFEYFRGMHDVNNSGWKTMTGEDGSNSTGEDAEPNTGGLPLKASPFVEEAMDAGLSRVESILKQVHGKFYFPKDGVTLEQQLAGRGSDVKVTLRDIRMTVLRKCAIAFDPAIMPRVASETDPRKYLDTLFAKAKACGAMLMDRVDAQTTHLISCGDTDLALYGKKLGIWVVRPEWLEKSEHYWQRVKEEPYSVFRTYGTKSRPEPSAGAPSSSLPNASETVGRQAQTSSDFLAEVRNDGDKTVNGDLDDFARELEMSMRGNASDVQQAEEEEEEEK